MPANENDDPQGVHCHRESIEAHFPISSQSMHHAMCQLMPCIDTQLKSKKK